MRLRLELFVDDLAVSEAFYTDVLGFAVAGRTDGYLSLVRGAVILGLGPLAKLPPSDHGPGAARLAPPGGKGAGVEIVLELPSVAALTDLYGQCRARGLVREALTLRPWGLRDFRLVDPDGYYLRLTHLPAD